MSERKIDDAELFAFADGQLDAKQTADVEAFLSANPDKADEVAQIRRQNAAINALFGSPAAEPVPQRLQVRRLRAQGNARRWAGLRLAAAAVVLVGLGIGTGWMARDWSIQVPSEIDRLIRTATTAHTLYVREQRHAVEVAASDEDHLVTWLGNRIDYPFSAPDLSNQGFSLVGGRLLPPALDVEAGPVAQLMYENATAERVTVFITAPLPDRADRFQEVEGNGLAAYFWSDGAMTCTVVGSIGADAMEAVSRQVYQQLSWRPDPTPS
jgi:anti-sigma factor RsiW